MKSQSSFPPTPNKDKRQSRSKESILVMVRGFTLIEWVLVIGILAILAVVVVVVLNPAEWLRQSRDSNRISDLQTINSALGYYLSDGGSSFGVGNTVYVSIPDSDSGCVNLGLPALPAGWSYKCATSANFRKVDSNGWIPVNLTSVSFGSPLDTLPVDPINTTSSGNYYAYTPGGSWELNGFLESGKYRNSSASNQYLPGIVKIGTDLNLSPIANTTGLVGYWKFDEGSGTTATDSSGNGNTGAWNGTGSRWATGKVGSYAGQFNGIDDHITAND